MAKFRPQVHITRQGEKLERIQFRTYRELKREIPSLLKLDEDAEGLFVVRSKRGQWGEWFERWKLENGKPTIVKEGWS